jgi:hypothetical protein
VILTNALLSIGFCLVSNLANVVQIGYGAEVDLETGETVEIGFRDPQIIQAIARTQGKALQFSDTKSGRAEHNQPGP